MRETFSILLTFIGITFCIAQNGVINGKTIGGIVGFIFFGYGIYLMPKNKKPTANNV